MSRLRIATALLALTAVAACGSDSSVAPASQGVTLDQALSELSIPALSATAASFGATGATIPALVPSSCAYQAASQSFACTPIVASGLTITQGFTLLGSSGAKQAAFDKATTSSVRAITTVAGTLQQGDAKLTVDAQQDLTLSGLLTATHTLDGTSTVKLVGAGSATSAPQSITVTTTIAGLALRAPDASGTHPWPTAGTIAVDASIAVATFPAVQTHATITFSGTSKVTVTFTEPGGSRTCTMDLASQAPTCQ